jgi:hypothetical protein
MPPNLSVNSLYFSSSTLSNKGLPLSFLFFASNRLLFRVFNPHFLHAKKVSYSILCHQRPPFTSFFLNKKLLGRRLTTVATK